MTIDFNPSNYSKISKNILMDFLLNKLYNPKEIEINFGRNTYLSTNSYILIEMCSPSSLIIFLSSETKS